MEFDALIQRRESVRSYDPSRIVPIEVINKILKAGIIAPTAANRQPFRFIVVSSKKELEKVRPCYKGDFIKDTPHILIVIGLVDKAWVRWDGYNSVETDCTIAMDHMILAAENEGVGTCWIAAFDNEILSKALKLQDNEKVFAITPLGYAPSGYQLRKKTRKSFDEIVSYI